MRRLSLPLLASVLTLSAAGLAQPAIHDDASPTGATVDGTLTAGEYGTFTNGINSSFGGIPQALFERGGGGVFFGGGDPEHG